MFEMLIKNIIETARASESGGNFSIDAVQELEDDIQIWAICKVQVGNDGSVYAMSFSYEKCKVNQIEDILLENEHVSMNEFINMLSKSIRIDVSIA